MQIQSLLLEIKLVLTIVSEKENAGKQGQEEILYEVIWH